MIDLALFLKRNGYRPDQVQDFIPAPFDIATCMYYTGLDPFTGEEVYTAKHLRDRKLQRALLQFFKPENYFEVREALLKAGRRRPDRLGLRLPDPGQSPQGRAAGPDAQGQQGVGRRPLRPHRRGPVPGEARARPPRRPVIVPIANRSRGGRADASATKPPGEGPESLLQLPS